MQTIIDKALGYVKERFENEFSGHDFFHTLRVYNMATRIAECEGAELEIVQLAALLHDVDDRKLSPATYENLDNAVFFLRENGKDEKYIERILTVIREISFGANDTAPSTLEGKCVQDADRLDAIGAIGIARAFAYGGARGRFMHHPDILPRLGMTKEEYRGSESTTVNHFYEKLFQLKESMNTATAIGIAERRDGYMHHFIDEFMNEWNGLV